MPRKPPHRCTAPGCPALVYRGGRCRRHAIEHDGKRDRTADKRFFNSKAWKCFRFEILSAHPICQRCNTAPSTDVHHIRPRRLRPDLALVESNVEALCHSCHSRHTLKVDVLGQQPEI